MQNQRIKANFLRDAVEARQKVDVFIQTQFCDRVVCQLPEAIRDAPVARLELSHSLSFGPLTCGGPINYGGVIQRVVFPWSACHYMVRTDQLHCVDWSLLSQPGMQVEGYEVPALREQYARMNPDAKWSGDVSVGPPIDWSTRVERPARRLPNGWRVFDGGRA